MSEELKPTVQRRNESVACRDCGRNFERKVTSINGFDLFRVKNCPECERKRNGVAPSEVEQQQAARIAELEHLLKCEQGLHAQTRGSHAPKVAMLVERIAELEASLEEWRLDLESLRSDRNQLKSAAKEMAEALEAQAEALEYAGVGDDRPHNRLILLIEGRRSESRGDDWDYWNYVC